ncbi:energy-coupling factor transporter ATPase [Gemella sp. 19428wG2_WT2a]|nr:energy-coupling factor transporter ATPase [Gemella sp. 19428wG2_WT2a]TFU60188.1 energy-coupling factor transporter ATPase [Gemella sp. WT2a]
MQISFEKVNFSYNPKTLYERQALSNINLDIPRGKFTTIIGKTGSGKSTLIEHINGLLIADSGSVKLGNLKVEKKSSRRERRKMDQDLFNVREKIAVLFQFSEQQLFETNVLKDIIFAPINYGIDHDLAVKRAKELINLVGLDESYLERSPFELSGGEMRKVALCGILALKPKVLVLDEPTIGLDFKSKQEFMTIIDRIHKEEKITIVFVTHNMDYVLEYADNIVIMKNGKVAFNSSDKGDFLEIISREDYNLKKPDFIIFQEFLKKRGINLSRTHYSYKSLTSELVSLVGASHE